MHPPQPDRYIPLPTRPPHGEAEWQKAYNDIQRTLVSSVQKVEQKWARTGVSSHDSVYIGVTGLAMMQYHLASNISNERSKDDTLDAKRLRHQADHNLYAVVHRNRIPPIVQDSAHASFLETPVGQAALVIGRCVRCLESPSYSEDENVLGSLRMHWDAAVHLLGGALKRVIAEDESEAANGLEEDGGSEVLYGRAGFLYTLLYLRKVVGEAKKKGYFEALQPERRKDVVGITSDASLKRVVDGIMRRGRAGARRYKAELEHGSRLPTVFPLMWRWHGKAYLGGAHGVFGILQTLLSCPRAVIEEHLGEVMSTIQWIVTVQDSEGNWPAKAPSSHDLRHSTTRSNELVQWCHGAPGAVTLLSTVLTRSSPPHNLFPLHADLTSHIKDAIRRGADLIYERGLLRKGLGLCHGVGGSVYALLSASSVLDSSADAPYLKRAVHLADLATLADRFVDEGVMGIPERPWSMYEGLAGMCCAWADVLRRLADTPEKRMGRASGMPGYDDLL